MLESLELSGKIAIKNRQPSASRGSEATDICGIIFIDWQIRLVDCSMLGCHDYFVLRDLSIMTIGNAQIPIKQSVKNLGFTLDCHLTMNAHVSNIARTCYFEVRRLASIRRFLTSTVFITLVSAFFSLKN